MIIKNRGKKRKKRNHVQKKFKSVVSFIISRLFLNDFKDFFWCAFLKNFSEGFYTTYKKEKIYTWNNIGVKRKKSFLEDPTWLTTLDQVAPPISKVG